MQVLKQSLPHGQQMLCKQSVAPALPLHHAQQTHNPCTQRLSASQSHCPTQSPLLATPLRTSAGRSGLVVRADATSSAYSTPHAKVLVLDVAPGKQITLETGEIGRLANGAIMATEGATTIYATACCSNNPTGDGSFAPLTINYAERFSAAGRTSGGYIKRDGRPKDMEVLVSRLVDRPLRPMIKQGWANETQVLEWVLSYDGETPTEPLAITAAGAALLVSDIPLTKAVAGVRVGWLPQGGIVINPTVDQMEVSSLDLIIAGTRDAILMIEGFCNFLTEDQLLQAIAAGHKSISGQCEQLEAWAAQVGKAKRLDQLLDPLPQELAQQAENLVRNQLTSAYRESNSKEVRGAAVEAARTSLCAQFGPDPASSTGRFTEMQVNNALKKIESDIMRRLVLTDGLRADGRGVRDVRPITSRAGLLGRTHGSALFTRGETQALCVTTLGSEKDAMRTDSIRSDPDGMDNGTRFYLQYHFPPSSVGETGRTGAPGRRELGHGELAQRALAPSVPPVTTFPYTVRVESTITESNGSSSMASVCGGCLSMIDAGVPVQRPVAGIAMGLILEADGNFAVLTDILGSEDALGDMDFKVAGDNDGVTAFQMDIKVEGITLEIMAQALAQAKEGRCHILAQMAKCNPPPRRGLSDFAPRVIRTRVDPSKRSMIVGQSGKTIKQIMELSGAVSIDIDESGLVDLCAPTQAAAQQALEYINLISTDPESGVIFRRRKVVSLSAFGCFVEIGPGRQGLVHISELDVNPVSDVSKVVSPGDLVDVMVLECNNGKLNLSRKRVIEIDSGKLGVTSTPTRPRGPPLGSMARGAGGPRGAGMSGGRRM